MINRIEFSALNNRQATFVAEYAKVQHGTNAAIKAGYSKKTAEVQASTLLRNPKIVAAVKRALDLRAHRTGITQDRILKEEACLAFADPREIFRDGTLIPPSELPDEVARAISSIELIERTREHKNGESTTERFYKYRFWDKGKSLERLYKHLGMFAPDRIDLSVQGEITLRPVEKMSDNDVQNELSALAERGRGVGDCANRN